MRDCHDNRTFLQPNERLQTGSLDHVHGKRWGTYNAQDSSRTTAKITKGSRKPRLGFGEPAGSLMNNGEKEILLRLEGQPLQLISAIEDTVEPQGPCFMRQHGRSSLVAESWIVWNT